VGISQTGNLSARDYFGELAPAGHRGKFKQDRQDLQDNLKLLMLNFSFYPVYPVYPVSNPRLYV
jgi:hypothetical protein